jgi:hypothetical protein
MNDGSHHAPNPLRGLALVVMAAGLLAACRRSAPSEEETTSSSAKPKGASPTATVAPTAAPKEVGDPRVIAEIIDYHNTKSEMAGKMTMTGITQLRIDDITDKARVAHAEYTAEPVKRGQLHLGGEYRWAGLERTVPGVEAARDSALAFGWADGTQASFGPYRWATIKDGEGKPSDSRTFEYRRTDGAWAIKSMGGAASASFGADLEGWSDGRAIEALTEFYNKRGEWAGRFRIGHVERYRVDRTGTDGKLGFIQYLYVPLPGNHRETDFDKRTFHFEKRSGSWVVTKMDGFMSAAKGLMR